MSPQPQSNARKLSRDRSTALKRSSASGPIASNPIASSETLARLAQEVQQMESASRRPTGTKSISTGCMALDACLPTGGYVPGTVIEYLRATSGCGATYLALTAAATALTTWEEKYLVIVDTHHQLYPPALLSHGIALSRVIWVRPQSPADAIWAVDQALRTPAVAAVVADLESIDERDARRLQLAAERGGGLGLLLRSMAARRMPSWAEVQWVVRSQVTTASATQPTYRPLVASSFDGTTTTKQPLRRLEVGLARVRGGKAGAQLLLDIDAATGKLELASREKTSHEPSTRAASPRIKPQPKPVESTAIGPESVGASGPIRVGQTSPVHLATQLADSTSASRRTTAG